MFIILSQTGPVEYHAALAKDLRLSLPLIEQEALRVLPVEAGSIVRACVRADLSALDRAVAS